MAAGIHQSATHPFHPGRHRLVIRSRMLVLGLTEYRATRCSKGWSVHLEGIYSKTVSSTPSVPSLIKAGFHPHDRLSRRFWPFP